MKFKLIFIILLVSPLCFYAWGKEGHQMVAQIAKKNLKPGVEAKVQAILGQRSFEQASIWMDSIKGDKSHAYDNMSPWHYLNIEKDSVYAKNPKGDIVEELNLVIQELRNYKKMPPAEVNKDVMILFHLCGDITMPLHVGYGSDRGGNSIKLTYTDPGMNYTENTNLHRIWDTDIILSEKITTDSCLSQFKLWTKKQKAAAQKIDVMHWMNDSRAFLPKVYNYTDNTISKEYILESKIIIEDQICKGGLYLAAVLNELFGS